MRKRKPVGDGMNKVIFVRANDELIERLDAYCAKYANREHLTVSRSDVVRKMILDTLARDEEPVRR